MIIDIFRKYYRLGILFLITLISVSKENLYMSIALAKLWTFNGWSPLRTQVIYTLDFRHSSESHRHSQYFSISS